MAKYIDADLLRKEVKRLEKTAHKSAIDCAGSETRKFHEGKDFAYQHVGILIYSLQQDKAAVELEQCPPILAEFMEKASEIGKKYNYGFGPNLSSFPQPKMDLEEFTQKMDDWKARYNCPDNIPIKATMAFTARMFYQYPDVARQWYDSLPKATMDE